MVAVIAPSSAASAANDSCRAGVGAGQLEAVLGRVDERAEHAEVAGHRLAVRARATRPCSHASGAGTCCPADVDQVPRDVDVGVLARRDGAQHLEDARAGRPAGSPRCWTARRRRPRGRRHVDVGARAVGGGEPRAHERRVARRRRGRCGRPSGRRARPSGPARAVRSSRPAAPAGPRRSSPRPDADQQHASRPAGERGATPTADSSARLRPWPGTSGASGSQSRSTSSRRASSGDGAGGQAHGAVSSSQ